MANRLASATSPYLLQHASNPVDWWEWGPDAFAEARRRDTPLLLSVGYAACHWCHVMAHESFDDAVTAAAMNQDFVNVKVDREERPDVDAVYMAAVQGMTGHGGWPMTVWCTPDGQPFYAGTYFPPEPRHGMPSFRGLLSAIADAWRDRKDAVQVSAAEITVRLADQSRRSMPVATGGPPTADQLATAVTVLGRQFDERYAGFGRAPKFPPSMVCEFLLRHHARTGSASARHYLERTVDAMARGGIYDQLAGGFARYSVDGAWVVPHFEKMLYDNALLLGIYVRAWRVTGSSLHRRVAAETADWLLREMRTSDGGFASSLDADAEGVEGLSYAWTPEEFRQVLGTEDGAWAAKLFLVTEEGSFEHGSSTLRLPVDPTDISRWNAARQRLLTARRLRPQPACDDKIVAAWNGWAIASLAEAGAVLDRPDLVAAAVTAAELLVAVHCRQGRLVRTSRGGVAGGVGGILEDYAAVASGFLVVHAVTGAPQWLERAGELLDTALDRFADEAIPGRYFDTADDAERLVIRPGDPADNATPSGQSALADALLTYAGYTGSQRHRQAAMSALGVTAALATTQPRSAGWGLAVAEAVLDGPREVVVVGVPSDARTAALRRAAWLSPAPGLIRAVGEPGGVSSPLTRGRVLVGDQPAAYICREFQCEAPVTKPGDVASALSVPAALD
jgi:uncharacterized protein